MTNDPMTDGPVVPGRQLDADGVRALFAELSERLAVAGVSAQLFVVGGAAMALAYDRDRLTRDVDALFAPAPEVRQIAEEMSVGHGLEPDWLNDAAKAFLPGDDEHRPQRLLNAAGVEGIQINRSATPHLTIDVDGYPAVKIVETVWGDVPDQWITASGFDRDLEDGVRDLAGELALLADRMAQCRTEEDVHQAMMPDS